MAGSPGLSVGVHGIDGCRRDLLDPGAGRAGGGQAADDPESNHAGTIDGADRHAIVTSRGAILTRPGAPSREGEVTAVGAALDRWFPELGRITPPGTLDGGDVCEAGDHFFIGLSERTNEEGAAQLGAWLAARDFGSSVIDIRKMPAMLHLKTGLSWLGGRRLIAWREVVGHEALLGWEVLGVPKGEEYAANCIRVNDTVLVADGFPETTALLHGLGYEGAELDMSEYRKMDGGLSCLSVRW